MPNPNNSTPSNSPKPSSASQFAPVNNNGHVA